MNKEDARKELDEVDKQMETVFKSLATECNRIIEERLKGHHIYNSQMWSVVGTNVGFNFTNASFEASITMDFGSRFGCQPYNVTVKIDSSYMEVYPPWPSVAAENLKRFFADYASPSIQRMLKKATSHHRKLLKAWADAIRLNVHASLEEEEQ